MNDYEKILLKSYPLFGKVTERIDRRVERRALASFYSRESCETIANGILALTETKADLLEAGRCALCPRETANSSPTNIGGSSPNGRGSTAFPANTSAGRRGR